MQDYKEILQRYLSGESKRHIAKIMGISRNTVDKYCEGGTLPWECKVPECKSTVITNDVTEFILSCLKEDAEVSLKKQRHTARRIYEQFVAECRFTDGESTFHRKVHELKATLPVAYIPF